MKSCFLFDVDGTVADTVPQMAISIRNSFSALGRDYPPESEVRGYVGNGLDKLVLRSMKRDFNADYSDFSDEEFGKFKKAYSEEYMRQITGNYTLFPGVAETVRKLKAMGKMLGIVTNKPQPYIEPFLRSAGIFECFDFTLGGGVIKEKKPSPAPILYAMEKMGREQLPEETMRRFVGPSLLYSFRTFCGMSEEEAERAIVLYRECYSAGEAYNLTVYDGMWQLLEALGKNGILCAVVTSKPQAMAEKVLEHFDLRRFFACVAGPDPSDGSNRKSVLIERALKELGVSSQDAVMVGDTRFDIIGAAQAGCDSIGVTYGYGTVEELKENDATYIVDSAAGIGQITGVQWITTQSVSPEMST